MIKKLFVLALLFLTGLISLYLKDDKIYYVSLGDGLSLGINENNYIDNGYSDYVKDYLKSKNKLKYYTKSFSKQDIRITDLINMINNNIEVNNINIQNALNKADLITLSIGMNEIMYKYSNNTNKSYLYDYIDSYIIDMENLIKLIKKYNNKKIYVLGLYNPINHTELDKYIIYSNNKLINLCNKENINYVDLYNIFKNNSHLIYNLNNYYPNKDGNKIIANEIIKKLKIM